MTTTPPEEENVVTPDAAAAYAGAPSGEAITHDLDAAHALVRKHTGSADVPTAVIRSAVLDVASDLYSRRQHHNGVVTFDSPDGVTALRVNRDPMASAYPLLRPYVTPPLA